MLFALEEMEKWQINFKDKLFHSTRIGKLGACGNCCDEDCGYSVCDLMSYKLNWNLSQFLHLLDLNSVLDSTLTWKHTFFLRILDFEFVHFAAKYMHYFSFLAFFLAKNSNCFSSHSEQIVRKKTSLRLLILNPSRKTRLFPAFPIQLELKIVQDYI